MADSRRQFIGKSLLGAGGLLLSSGKGAMASSTKSGGFQSKPWLELSKDAYLSNVADSKWQARGGGPQKQRLWIG